MRDISAQLKIFNGYRDKISLNLIYSDWEVFILSFHLVMMFTKWEY